MSSPSEEAHIHFSYHGETFQTFVKVFGDLDAGRAPVIILHGGPGLTHDYMLSHADLAHKLNRPVIFYDQIGNGRSTRLPHKPRTFFTIDFFLDELANLLEHFGVSDEYDIVGHSWGGMMACEFIVRREPHGLERLVIADSPSSIALWNRSFGEILEQFPLATREALLKGPDKDREAYWKAMTEVYAVCGCRVPFPAEFLKTLEYRWGEHGDRTVDGDTVLKGWDIASQLHSVNVPTLLINGRYDIAQDYVTEAYDKNIHDCRWVRFHESSHMPFWEERETYMQVVAVFLQDERYM